MAERKMLEKNIELSSEGDLKLSMKKKLKAFPAQ
jgi:hypothetical protein